MDAMGKCSGLEPFSFWNQKPIDTSPNACEESPSLFPSKNGSGI